MVYISSNQVRSFNTHTSSGVIYLDDDIRNTKLGISVSKSSSADLQMFQNDRLKFLHNPLITYLNINCLRNKVIDLGKILKDLPLDYLVINKTKLDESFPNAQFKLNGYEVRVRRERHKHGGGLTEFVKQGFICKRLKNMNLTVVSVSARSLQFQRKSGSVLAYIALINEKY